jgi:thiol-disulfide isomerase/thioredoxin
MTKLSIFVLAFVLMVSACKKDDEVVDSLAPTSTQNGFAVEFTATWCGPCGDWGAPLIHKFGEEAPKGAVISCHASGDPMYDAALYGSFTADRTTGGGIPSFWVANEKTTNSSAMTNLIATGTAKAGVDYSYEVSGTSMTVKTRTKFFSPDAGEYYISVLVLEDGINGNSTAGEYKQNGTTNSYPNDDFHHSYVLRASSVVGNAYGSLLVSNPASSAEIDKDFTITLDASWKNTYPVVIIWKYNAAASAPQYEYINSLKKK